MATIAVSNIDEIVADLGSRGVSAKAQTTGSGAYRLAQVRDPDGNLLTFAQPQS
jgi:catechol 2,3-dioxygenase-like lactoylglutathione lyase family enzyme